MLLIRCTFLQSTDQTTNALNNVQFMTNIKLLPVSAPSCHPQGFLGERNTSQTR